MRCRFRAPDSRELQLDAPLGIPYFPLTKSGTVSWFASMRESVITKYRLFCSLDDVKLFAYERRFFSSIGLLGTGKGHQP